MRRPSSLIHAGLRCITDEEASSGPDREGMRVMPWSSRQVIYEKVAHMIPACAVRWVRPNLIHRFSVQFVVSAPKAQRVTSKLLGPSLNFAFEPGEYASSLPDIRSKQAYLRQLKETNEGAYIRYEWPRGFAEYVLFVKPVRLPDGQLIYGMQTQAKQPVRPLLHLPLIGSKRQDIPTQRPPYTLTLETLRSLAPGQPTRYVEPLERAYDARFPPLAGADWNVLTNYDGVSIAATRPYGEQWRRAIYQYGTRSLMGHPPAHWPTVLSILEGKTVLSLRTHLQVDQVIQQEGLTPQPAGATRLPASCYAGPCSFVLAEDEGFICCFVGDDEPLAMPVLERYLSLADWIGPGAAVLTPTQAEAREILRRRKLSAKEQEGLPAVETLLSLSHRGSQASMSTRFAHVIAEYAMGQSIQDGVAT